MNKGEKPRNQVEIHLIQSHDDIEVFLDEIKENKNNMSEVSYKKIVQILEIIGYPMTVVCELNYVDKNFRDTYYRCFAGKHFEKQKNCKRLSFFRENIEPEIFYKYDDSSCKKLNEAFVGTMILKPLKIGKVGLTLLNPQRLHIPKCYLRTAQFDFIILGNDLSVQAFPFSSQDTETMTCAETTVWSIVQYFGMKYSEYRTILPGDIIARVGKGAKERILPSRGLDYYVVSELLKEFGFSPRLYAKSSFEGENGYEFRRIFHYYVESGIPLAVGISGMKNNKSIRHSFVCIGHEYERKELPKIDALQKEEYLGVSCIDSSLFYDKYVISDDNQYPYVIQPFDSFTMYEKTEVVVLAVPLYKRVFLEAIDVRKIFQHIMSSELSFCKIIPQIKETVDEKNPLVTRVYLTSSRKYRSFRARSGMNPQSAYFYSSFAFPKFVWVIEISTYSSYLNNKIYGEIILDATASRMELSESLIMIRYLEKIGYRLPDESLEKINERLQCQAKFLDFPYDMYKNNLCDGGSFDDKL